MSSKAVAALRAFIALAVISLIAVLLLAGGDNAQAQNDEGVVSNLHLSSDSPGELTISWDRPSPAPDDYRIVWAREDLDFPSWRAANEANRGNEYPGGDRTSITLTGLTKGAVFKVMVRARYASGGDNDGPWSGPWTDERTAGIKETPPPPTATAVPTAVPTPSSEEKGDQRGKGGEDQTDRGTRTTNNAATGKPSISGAEYVYMVPAVLRGTPRTLGDASTDSP